VLESFVTKERDKAAALKFIKKALKRQVNRRRSSRMGCAASKQIGAAELPEVGRWKNNRAENSHLPFRRRERAMARFRRMKTLQKFSSVHASVDNHFAQERHLVSRRTYQQRRSAALASGGQCWPDHGWVWAQCAKSETSCRSTDSTSGDAAIGNAIAFATCPHIMTSGPVTW